MEYIKIAEYGSKNKQTQESMLFEIHIQPVSTKIKIVNIDGEKGTEELIFKDYGFFMAFLENTNNITENINKAALSIKDEIKGGLIKAAEELLKELKRND